MSTYIHGKNIYLTNRSSNPVVNLLPGDFKEISIDRPYIQTYYTNGGSASGVFVINEWKVIDITTTLHTSNRFSDDGNNLITYNGKGSLAFQLFFSVSSIASAGTLSIEFGLGINGNDPVIPAHQATVINPTFEDAVSGTFLNVLSPNDTIQFFARNNTSTAEITINHLDIIITPI